MDRQDTEEAGMRENREVLATLRPDTDDPKALLLSDGAP